MIRILREHIAGKGFANRRSELRGAETRYVAEADRRTAIRGALAWAQASDTIVIAGKGHETYQEIAGGVKLPFDDREVAREALRARLGR